MTVQDAMEKFDYPQALRDLGISLGSESLWEDLYHRSCCPNPQERLSLEQLPQLQCLHDLSWVLTQCDPSLHAALNRLSENIKKSLVESFGPYIFECCQERNFTLEGVLLPLAKTFRQTFDAELSLLVRLFTQTDIPADPMELPTESFVNSFVRIFVDRFLVSNLSSYSVPRAASARKFFLGWVEPCPVCGNAGVDKVQIDVRITQTRTAARQAVRSGRKSWADPAMIRRLIRFLGSQGGCFRCFGTGLDIQALGTTDMRQILDGDADSLPWEKYPCPNCFGQGDWQAGLNTPLAGNPSKTVNDLLQTGQDGLSVGDLRELLGEEILCKICTRWLQIPPHAEEGWICPIVDGYGEKHSWARLQWEGN